MVDAGRRHAFQPPSPGGKRARLDIIIPARGEGAHIAPCLRALLQDSHDLQLRTIVVANGERALETVASAESFRPAFDAAGHELIVMASNAGKATALNAGDAHRRGCPVAYLDADAVLLPGSLAQIHEALEADVAPLIVGPRLRVIGRDARLARDFMRVWSHLPAVRDGVIGGGCYAVNASGRQRWGAFPEISGDDAFACALFPSARRIALEPAGLFVRFPARWRDLVAMRARWLRSGREVATTAAQVRAAKDDVTPGVEGRGRIAALTAAKVLASLPAFLLIDIVARACLAVRRPGTPQEAGWRPVRPASLPAVNNTPIAPRVRVIIVTYNSVDYVGPCLQSVQSKWASLEIVVIDNASTDASAETASTFAGVSVVRSPVNRGFAAAVNIAAADLAASDFVLLLNPDAVMSPDAIDTMLALSLAAPDAGVIGARGHATDGKVIPASCLTRPTLWRAFLYAIGRSTGLHLPPSAYRDPTETRSVPAVSGACMLVRTDAWRRLGGLDERFFLYGEDVDFCLRARKAGYAPTTTALARYSHVGGASSASAVERACRLLAGDITLYRRHAGPVGPLAHGLIIGGVLLRLSAARLLNDDRWRQIWRRRPEWWRGYPPLTRFGGERADAA